MLNWLLPKVTAPFEKQQKTFDSVLASCNKALISGDDAEKLATLSDLISYSFGQPDLSFIGFACIPLLGSKNIGLRIVTFRALSLFLTASSPAVASLPLVLRRSFQYSFLITPALTTLTFLITPETYKLVKKDIADIVITSSDIPRKLSLIILYKVYAAKRSISPKLLLPLKSSLLHPSLCYTSLAILVEIATFDPASVVSFVPHVASEISIAGFHLFTKIAVFLELITKFNKSIQVKYRKQLESFVVKNENIVSLTAAARLVAIMEENSKMASILGQKLTAFLTQEIEIDQLAMILRSLNYLVPSFCPERVLLSGFMQHHDPIVKSEALKLYSSMTADTKSLAKEIFQIGKQLRDADTILVALDKHPHEGEEYVSLLFESYEVHLPNLDKSIAAIIRSCDNETLIELIITSVAESLFETPDDVFGDTIASLIETHSSNPDHISILLPPTLGKKSSDTQSNLLLHAIKFWVRLKFPMPKAIVHRILLLAQSDSLEVRQLAAEFAQLVDYNHKE